MCAIKGVSRLDLATGKLPKWHTCEACRGAATIGALQDKNSNLARQLACDLDLRLVPVARLSHQNVLFG